MKVLKEDYGDHCDFQKASKIVKEKNYLIILIEIIILEK